MFTKPFYIFLLIVSFTLSLAFTPGNLKMTKRITRNPEKAMKLTDDPVDIRTLTYEQSLKCYSPKLNKDHYQCVEEILAKMNISVSSKKNSTDELEDLSSEEIIYLKMLCECTLLKSGALDATTRQLTNFEIFADESSLSSEQKLSAISGTKLCLLNGRSESELPLFVKHIDKVLNVKSSSEVSAVQTSSCIVINLLENGCSDASVVSISSKTRLIRYFKTLMDKYGK